MLRFPFSHTLLRIGRHLSNDLTLPDEEISRFHMTLEQSDLGYRFTDLSRNGTCFNGKRVREAGIQHGDELMIGPWRVVFVDEGVWGDQETLVQRRTKPSDAFCGMVGKSEVMKRVFETIQKVAPTEATALILGETGVGKELVARAVHDLSRRSRKPFVAINCGAISPQLIESELFGHERGAFTGAVQRHAGAFEQAQGGTLFLDEIGELPLELQPKLLRVLEDRTFRRVGGLQELTADVRIVAATHRRLEAHVAQGKFREDLFFRLYTVPLVIPALRERTDDIEKIAENFLAAGGGKSLAPEALEKLIAHRWRGNVRELKNVLTRAMLFTAGDRIKAEDILFPGETGSLVGVSPEKENKPSPPDSLLDIQKQAIIHALNENGWNKRKAAESLKIAKSTLFLKIKEYRIVRPAQTRSHQSE